MTSRVIQGDCVEVMRGLPECSVDAIVTDPPYGLEFMGKDWDAPWKNAETVRVTDEATNGIFYTKGFSHGVRYSRGQKEMRAFQEWCEVWAVEALRVLKPGGHLLAFGGTRTFHRMTVAIEDAGFEVRDCLSWLYGSGFPKSLNVGKAIDKAAGVEREVIGTKDNKGRVKAEGWRMSDSEGDPLTAPATEEAARWEGWGTALKPAWEPVVLARKPLIGTVAANVLEHGTGGLNIDGSRIGTETIISRGGRSVAVTGDTREGAALGIYGAHNPLNTPHTGRWPANVLLDEDAAAMLDEQQEGASRFFYVAKASRRDRNEGLDGLPDKEWRGNYGDGIQDNRPHTSEGYTYSASVKNTHPTVKPVTLMRHLVRLVTPPGGTVLDPFAGSGTTLVAAILEGFDCIGIEMTDEYLPIIEGRTAWAAEQTFIRSELDKIEADSRQPTLLNE